MRKKPGMDRYQAASKGLLTVLVTAVCLCAFGARKEVVGSVARFLSAYEPYSVAVELINEPPRPCLWKGKPQ
jgi:hypothetical protein